MQRLNARTVLAWDSLSGRYVRQGDKLEKQTRKLTRLMAFVLPHNYPQSVRHPHYSKHSLYTFVEGFVGSAASVFATQAMLGAMLLDGAGGGKLPIPEGTLPLAAATLNWVLKDGLGQLGGIGFVAVMGRRFDLHPQQLRMLSGLVLKAAVVLELCTPFVPGLFLPLAALAMACMNVSWMACSASRAPILKALGSGGGGSNLGELMGKAASQLTLASMLGLGFGMLLSETLILTHCSGFLQNLLVCLPLLAVGIGALWRSCRWAISNRLHPRRIERIVQDVAGTPEEMSRRESLFTFSKRLDRILLDVPLDRLTNADLPSSQQLEHSNYVVVQEDGKQVYVWLTADGTDEDALRAIVEAICLRDGLDPGAQLEKFSPPLWDPSCLGSLFKHRLIK